MSKMAVSRDKELNEIFLKCVDSNQAMHHSLQEGSIQFLMLEELDQSDILQVSNAIAAAEKQIDSVEDYLDGFGNLDRSKIGGIEAYMDAMRDALNTAKSELSGASFETGAVSSFLGQKLTLPRITQAAVALHTKAADFGTGFSKSINKVKAAVAPFAKNAEDMDKPIRELAGTPGIPSIDKMKKGIKKAIQDSLGGGFFKKVVNFFTSGPTLGAEKKILDQLPKIDNEAMAEQLADALLDSTLNELTKSPAPKPPETGQLSDVAQESQEVEEEQVEQGGQTEDTGADAPPPENEEEAQEEQDAASEELTSAIKDAGAGAKPPGAAVMDALDAWYGGLSPSSQQTLSASGRLDDLKNSVKTTMDNLADTVADEIRSAMSDWRGKHEETLIKSRRFAKKNFDTLEQTVPELASFMLKKVDESSGKISKTKIRKTVFRFLDRRFKPGLAGVLTESYSTDDMEDYRMRKLAGLD